jgi:hypothetical protein
MAETGTARRELNQIAEQYIKPLEQLLLDESGNLKSVPASSLKNFSTMQFQLFGHKHGIYQIVTHELVDFIGNEIDGDSAIEIGSGNGCLGRTLGIPMTDSWIQATPEVKEFYDDMYQPIVNYREDVEKLEANDAIDKYKPDVVVGAWVSQLKTPTNEVGSPFGVDEVAFIGKVRKYILVGNLDSHAEKDILKITRNRSYTVDWLYSRSAAPMKNRIWIIDCEVKK